MTTSQLLSTGALLLSLNLLGGFPFHPEKGTPSPGRPREIPHTHERAGYPLSPAHHLEPSDTPNGHGYYVGGGNAFHGDPRAQHEGTWGYDDQGGHLFPRRTQLRWNHGRRFQGGTGAYRTDRERAGH